VGIDNYGKSYYAMQLFATSKGACVFEKVEEVWERFIFYDCPGPAVLAGDFTAGLAVSVARSAVKKKEKVLKARENYTAKGKGRADDFGNDFDDIREIGGDRRVVAGSPQLQPYEPDSQTIITDCITDIEELISLSNGNIIVLQHYQKHAVDAIKARLIRKGYPKASRNIALNLIWNWVKAPDIEALETVQQALLDHICPAERIYLTNYYEPKEPSFCSAYTLKYPNLGVNSTQRNEKQHHIGSGQLSKNIPTSRTVEIITEELNSLPKRYNDLLNKSRLTDPRLIDKSFFC
jgi:hypothetical protein